MKKFVIAIGREFGSGGKEIATKLAEKLNIKCYDNELLTIVAKNSGFCEEILQQNDEQPTSSLLYSVVMDTYSMVGHTSPPFVDMPMNHKIFLAQFEAIKKLASEESCVIIGRCADYALADDPNCFSVFIHAPLEFRVGRIKAAKTQSFKTDKQYVDYINKNNKRRANYYNYYSGKKWGHSESYHMTIDSSVLGIDDTVELLYHYVTNRFA